MRTQYFTATSLDGFIATDDNSLDWLFELGTPEGNFHGDFFGNVGAMAMGSSTYEWLLRQAFGAEAVAPEPWPYEHPCWVFTSRDLPGIPGADIRFVHGDVAPVHAEMAKAAAPSWRMPK